MNLILRLYEMRRDDRMREARNWFTGNFKVRTLEEWTALCAPGTDANASYRMVTSYWEMVASFITSGVLNPELFYQSGRELLFCYARVRHVLPALREKLGNPGELKNLETVAQGLHRLVEPAVTGRLRRLLQAHRRLGNRPFAG